MSGPMKKILVAAAILLSLGAGCRSGVPDGVYSLPAGETIDISSAPDHLTLIDFVLPDNESCRFSDSIFREVAEKFRGDARFVSVDVSQHGAFADSLGVAALPAILVIRSDGQRDWHIGPMTSDELDSTIRDARD